MTEGKSPEMTEEKVAELSKCSAELSKCRAKLIERYGRKFGIVGKQVGLRKM